MTPVIDLLYSAPKCTIIPEDVSNTIQSCQIKMDDGTFVEPFYWQKQMLYQAIELSLNVRYKIFRFNANQYYNGFLYNILYNYGEFYLVNINTHKYRLFKIKFNEN